MVHIAPMKDMAMTPEEVAETLPAPVAERVKDKGPQYPWGLCLRLGTEELDKLKAGELQVGDTVHIFALAKVTSVSASADEGGDRRSAELQITQMSLENEDAENEDADIEEEVARQEKKRQKWYGDGPKSEDY